MRERGMNSSEAEEILRRALEVDSSNRFAFVAKCCEGRPELKKEVELLLIEKYETVGAPSHATAALKSDHIGAYRLLRKIGEGGMGVVYLAERSDAQYRKQVAVKVVKHGSDSEEIL